MTRTPLIWLATVLELHPSLSMPILTTLVVCRFFIPAVFYAGYVGVFSHYPKTTDRRTYVRTPYVRRTY